MSQILEIIKILKKEYPNAKYYLDYNSPVQLMVAAILSAQCKDEVVNSCTKTLFKKYSSAKDFANSQLSELTKDIKSITFPNNKAKNIISACKLLVKQYNSQVPKTVDELTSLPGIGRKTANVILANAYNIVIGIAIDTHCIRISYRLGWTKNKDPEKIEQDLMKIIPKEDWKQITHLLKSHGRAICKAPIPFCSKCSLNNLCPKHGVAKKL